MRCGPDCRQKGCGLERGVDGADSADPGEEVGPVDGEKGTTEVLDEG